VRERCTQFERATAIKSISISRSTSTSRRRSRLAKLSTSRCSIHRGLKPCPKRQRSCPAAEPISVAPVWASQCVRAHRSRTSHPWTPSAARCLRRKPSPTQEKELADRILWACWIACG
jgi:hypothetical protein